MRISPGVQRYVHALWVEWYRSIGGPVAAVPSVALSAAGVVSWLVAAIAIVLSLFVAGYRVYEVDHPHQSILGPTGRPMQPPSPRFRASWLLYAAITIGVVCFAGFRYVPGVISTVVAWQRNRVFLPSEQGSITPRSSLSATLVTPVPTEVPPSVTVNLFSLHVTSGPLKPCTLYMFSASEQGSPMRAEFRVQAPAKITNFRVGTTDTHINSNVRFGQGKMTPTGCKIASIHNFSKTPLFEAYETSDNVVNVAINGILPSGVIVMGLIGQNTVETAPPLYDGQLQYEEAGAIKSRPVTFSVHPMVIQNKQ